MTATPGIHPAPTRHARLIASVMARDEGGRADHLLIGERTAPQ
ncbi:MAG: hypothetical protein ACKOEY_12240 [Phenylobacterium sp.]